MAKVELCDDCKTKGYCQYLVLMGQIAHSRTEGATADDLQVAAEEIIETVIPDIRLEAYKNGCLYVRKK